jgi:beta-mannosidase
MKGANQVPLDYYPDRMKNNTELEWLFRSAIEANYNIIRIWGGGMYMDDNFYELADKYGILIW